MKGFVNNGKSFFGTADRLDSRITNNNMVFFDQFYGLRVSTRFVNEKILSRNRFHMGRLVQLGVVQ